MPIQLKISKKTIDVPARQGAI